MLVSFLIYSKITEYPFPGPWGPKIVGPRAKYPSCPPLLAALVASNFNESSSTIMQACIIVEEDACIIVDEVTSCYWRILLVLYGTMQAITIVKRFKINTII